MQLAHDTLYYYQGKPSRSSPAHCQDWFCVSLLLWLSVMLLFLQNFTHVRESLRGQGNKVGTVLYHQEKLFKWKISHCRPFISASSLFGLLPLGLHSLACL